MAAAWRQLDLVTPTVFPHHAAWKTDDVLADTKNGGLPKLVGKPIYREMTMRTYGTCQKILAAMDED